MAKRLLSSCAAQRSYHSFEPANVITLLPSVRTRGFTAVTTNKRPHSPFQSQSHTLFLPSNNARCYASTASPPLAGVSSTTEERQPGAKVATITISNPAKLNIVNTPILQDLVKTCRALAEVPDLRCVVLTGGPTKAGKAASFVGGADINEMGSLSSADEARTFITRIHEACQALRELPVPVLGRVDGLCLGAGLEVLAACDLRIATKTSTFGMPEVRIGLPSVVEAALLPGLIGMGRTRRLLYLAENLSGDVAERWGLVERVVEDEVALDGAVDEWVRAICSMGPKAMRIQKSLMQTWERCGSVDDAVQAGVEAFGEAYADGGEEPKEFMGRFHRRAR